jgi:formylglycine-generating enzyme required for sulfatase activity
MSGIAAAGSANLVPRDANGPHFARGADGRFAVAGEARPDWPVLGLSWLGAQAYARWQTERARAEGLPFKFALPTFGEWKVAGHGSNRRHYPFGTRVRPKWVKSNYSRPVTDSEPGLRYPIDESIFGA